MRLNTGKLSSRSSGSKTESSAGVFECQREYWFLLAYLLATMLCPLESLTEDIIGLIDHVQFKASLRSGGELMRPTLLCEQFVQFSNQWGESLRVSLFLDLFTQPIHPFPFIGCHGDSPRMKKSDEQLLQLRRENASFQP
jgi:hypothetical protein